MGSKRMLIKVCGMRDADNIRQLEKSCIADWMGMIFFPKSPRNVTERPGYLPKTMKRIGVFVNPSIDALIRTWHDFSLDGIQLHGSETPEFIRTLRQKGVPLVIKAFSLSGENDLKQVNDYAGLCDYFLFDTKCTTVGGSGKTFDWNLLQAYNGKTPFLLSGGLSINSLSQLAGFRHPQWAGIDLNSCFETAPAVKDIALLTRFCKEFKALHHE